MAEIKLLKIGALGIPSEFDSASDQITLASFSVQGGGPVVSSTGIDMNNLDVSDIKDLRVTDPTTATINATAGNVIIDDLMAKDRANAMAVGSNINFQAVTDAAGPLSALRLPVIAGAPTAAPTAGAGSSVYDNTNNKLYIYDGAAWDDQSSVQSAESIVNIFLATGVIAARDVVYIDAADHVNKALASADASSLAIGFAVNSAIAEGNVEVKSEGILGGFSALTAGNSVYLSAAVAGTITQTIPVGAGNVIVKCGIAKSATDVFIDFQFLGRRAA